MSWLRCLHLSTVHQPLDNRINLKECRTLAGAGHDVAFAARRLDDPSRSPVRLVDLGTFGSRRQRFLLGWLRSLRVIRAEKPTVLHIHDPELLPLAWLHHVRGGVAIYDAHEDLRAQTVDKDYLPRRTRRAASRAADFIERQLARRLDAVVTATPSIGARFPAESTVVVQNFPRLDELAAPADRPFATRARRVAYVGGITAVRGARELVAAVERLPDKLDAQLTLAGPFSDDGLRRDLATQPAWRRVDAPGWLDRPSVASLLADSRCGVVTYLPLANHLEAQPTKLFEYLAAGIPVIASDFPHWRSMVDAGVLFVDPTDPSAIADAMEWVLTHDDEAAEMGRAGRRAVEERFSWDHEAAKLVELYDRLRATA